MSERKSGSWRQRLKIGVAASLGGFLLKLLALTWRVTSTGGEGIRAVRRDKRGAIFVVWHGELFPVLWAHRGEGITALISTHADGEIIARIVESLGFHTVRGSTSRGGARALLEIVRELEAGKEVAITPDGPRGPRREFSPGALVAAMRAGAPVIAFGMEVDRAWRFRSWDRFVLPKPFAKVTVRTTTAEPVSAASLKEIDQELPRFRALLMSVCSPDEP